MRLGVSLASAHAIDDPREGARWMIERAAAARHAGLDSLFVGDHHATLVPYYQNVPILARLLAEWGDAPAGCLFLLPLWSPVLVAEQVGTLAALARGRELDRLRGMGYTDVIARHLTDEQPKVLGSLARLGRVRDVIEGGGQGHGTPRR